MPVYEYECNKCSNVFEEYNARSHGNMFSMCPSCGGTGERKYSLSTPKMFEPFTTRNILPDGKEVTIRGHKQLQQLEAEHHVKMTDKDAKPPQTMV